MRVDKYSFGSISIDGKTYSKDLVIEKGKIKKREKKKSKPLKGQFGHTPLSSAENIPWDAHKVIVGTGASGSLPLTKDLYEEASKRGVQIDAMPTEEAIKHFGEKDTNFVLHLTC